ncbi:helix-turn-helix domain-containing protein [Streptomyces sp. MBT62]|uniref:helix-turn-helix domain-containing protein n=1 Tax=unclassified Streptomyces TaxID=2593676 RepID=UPI001909FF9C|nr:helix-turn-helix domain-containing protein [Streptomyces sp. MBT62]MBK3562856.1 tetratricopeptide repeat protein [Streptomyces sp. MBT62]
MDPLENTTTAGLGDRIRLLRGKRGLKQQDLASSEISASYISLIESGKRAPSDAVLAALAERLGCSAEYLRSGRDDHELEEARLRLAFGEMALRNGSNGEALQTLSELLTKPTLLDVSMTRRARMAQASALEKLDRTEAAIAVLEELQRDPDLAPGSAEWCQIAVALCRCYRNAGDITLSIEIGERAMARLDALGLDVTVDHVQLGATLMGSFHMRGDLIHAQLMGGKLLDAAEKQGARAARGAVYWNAGLVARSRGQLNEALALVERALALMSEDDNLRHLAMLKMNYGSLLLQVDEPEPARGKQLLEEAQQLLAEVGNAPELAQCEIGLADADAMLGQWDEAAAHAERALGLTGTESRIQAVGARGTLAEIQLMRGNHEQAAQYLQAATRQLRQFRPSHQVALNWRYLGDLWKRQGNTAEALKAYDRALSAAGMAPHRDPGQILSEQHRA